MVTLRQNLVSENRFHMKCPYAMQPQFIVVHNTANDASAANEIQYMITNNKEISFHYAVDDTEVMQGILENRNAWHAGDGGNGKGNRFGIAVEICYSKSGGTLFEKAEQNAAIFIAEKLKEYGWGIEKVKKHQDFANKYCPHRTLDNGWNRFLNMIHTALQDGSNASEKYGVGTHVCVNKIWTQANGGILYRGDWKGTITKIIHGSEHPYLLNNGTGWTSDEAIDSDPHDPNASNIKYDNWLVDPGDTLTKIANYFACSVEELATYNHIVNPNIIHVGQIIYKPK